MSQEIQTVQPGCHITIELVLRSGKCELLRLDLVPDNLADYPNGFLGVSTPLAKTILGSKAGDKIPYFTDEFQAVIIRSVAKSQRKTDGAAFTQRQETIREAQDQIGFRDAVLYASSTGTKWGEYDPDGLDYQKWKASQAKPADIDKNESE